MEETRFVGKGIVKKDAEALLSGRPVYTDDLAPDSCLIIKLLRSPHAHAIIEDIKTDAARRCRESRLFLLTRMCRRHVLPRPDRPFRNRVPTIV